MALVVLRPSAAESVTDAHLLMRSASHPPIVLLDPLGSLTAQSTPQSAEPALPAAATALQSAVPTLQAAVSFLQSAVHVPALGCVPPEVPVGTTHSHPAVVTHTQQTSCVTDHLGQSWDVAWKGSI